MARTSSHTTSQPLLLSHSSLHRTLGALDWQSALFFSCSKTRWSRDASAAPARTFSAILAAMVAFIFVAVANEIAVPLLGARNCVLVAKTKPVMTTTKVHFIFYARFGARVSLSWGF